MKWYQRQVEQTVSALRQQIVRQTFPVSPVLFTESGYKTDNRFPPLSSFRPLTQADRLTGKDRHAWIHFTVQTPGCGEGQAIRLVVRTSQQGDWDALNPQGLLYVDGKIVQGLDINHVDYPLEADRSYDVYIYFYTGMYDAQVTFSAEIQTVDLRVERLYYDMRVPLEALGCFDENGREYARTLGALGEAANLLDLRQPGGEAFRASVAAASGSLQREFYQKQCGKDLNAPVVSCVGHTHIDVAWLWTFAQTKEKAQRSFATVLSLMNQYPEYQFMSSQPQLYQFVKQEAPDLYEEIRRRAAQGRFEPEGAMWLEADCNLVSGESLVRQILFGKRFFKREFGVDSHILWLPDVFGYNAALPQILLKSGVDCFVTSKISWNQYNKLPYDTFWWQGIDGSRVFTYFLTAQDYKKGTPPGNATTYVGTITPAMVKGTWERYQQKAYNDEVMLTYGYGDGGGGPTREMLEFQRRLSRGLPGLPRTVISGAGECLARVRKKFDEGCRRLRETPAWVGELYLEMHRGTYTTAVRNKKHNRRAEILYQDAEAVCAFDRLLNGGSYPQQELNRGWQTILLNQFHDVIPGSSIAEVYQDSERMYREVLTRGRQIFQSRLAALAAAVKTRPGVFVYNPNSFPATGLAEMDGRPITVRDVPPFGWRCVTERPQPAGEASVDGRTAETGAFRLTLDENGDICSLFDKRARRETVLPGARMNRMRLYEDRPYCYDAWELQEYYRHKPYDVDSCESIRPFRDEVSVGFVIRRRFLNSSSVQRIRMYREIERIDVQTTLDWHEEHLVLKLLFPVNVNATRATFDIQFGNLERPTCRNQSWDRAKFEVCAHKWVDVSEGNYGVSLLNDCKYGYGVDGSTISVTAVRAPAYPAPQIDRGLGSFTVSLFPHQGDFRTAGTIGQAYLLNNPLRFCRTDGHAGQLPPVYSMLSCDAPNLVVETVKQSEDGRGVIVRLYESHNEHTAFTLRFGFDVRKAYLCDLMENERQALPVKGNTVSLRARPFEVLTVKLL